ncbi:MAG: TetR/AcrR family transcriptional regulator [Bacteroidota bacterium]|jgi:AcrR family transcriptional regulator
MINKEEIRESVLKVAQEIFSRYGFHKTTMDDIAKGMGKGKSSIYYYFSSKEDIFSAVVEKELLELRSKIVESVTRAENPKEKLKAYVNERMQGLSKMVNLFNVLRTEFISQREFTDRIRMKTDEEEIGIIRSILDEGVSSGTFHLEDTYLTSIAIVTALKGMEVPLVIARKEENHLEMTLDRLLDVLFYGMLKR